MNFTQVRLSDIALVTKNTTAKIDMLTGDITPKAYLIERNQILARQCIDNFGYLLTPQEKQEIRSATLVADWEKSVENIKEMSASNICIEEYEYEIWSRKILDEVLKHTSEYEVSRYKNRIDEADMLFNSITIDLAFPDRI